jgi:hypothetical protein
VTEIACLFGQEPHRIHGRKADYAAPAHAGTQLLKQALDCLRPESPHLNTFSFSVRRWFGH